MLRATLRSVLARKLRLLLSALAVVLGVSFVAGALILTDSQQRGFDQLFATINENIAVEVRGLPTVGDQPNRGMPAPRSLVPTSVLAAVSRVDGVAEAVPSVSGTAVLIGRDGKPRASTGAPNIGTNLVDSPRLNLVHLVAGHAPHGPDEIAINRGLATSSGYGVGDTALVSTPVGQQRYTIVGVVAYSGDRSSLAGETLVLFDTATARRLLTADRGDTEVVAAAAGGVSQEQLRNRIQPVLPAGLEAVTGTELAAEQSNSVKEALGFFSTFLLVFAAVALFVGAFIIFNTFTILIAQRTRELALLRALGASRRQVTVAVVVEATVVGLIASAVGLGLGVGVAYGIKGLFNAIGLSLPDAGTVVQPRTIIAAFAVGIGVTVLAALLPARRAARVSPLAAMRDAVTPDRSLHRLVVGGTVVTLIGGGLLWFGLSGHGLSIVGAGALVTFLGVALLSPALSRPVVAALGTPLSRGVSGQLGRANSRRNPRRTAATAAALMIGIALVSALSVLGASTTATIAKVTDRVMGADFLVAGQRAKIDPVAVQRLRQVPGAATVSAMWVDRVSIDGKASQALIAPATALGSTVSMTVTAGQLAEFGAGRLLMSAKVADMNRLAVGTPVSVGFADGQRETLRLAATYEDNALLGDYVLAESVSGHLHRASYDLVLIKAAAGSDTGQVGTALRDVLAAYPALNLQDRSQFVAEQTKQVDQLIAVMNAMLALSVGIAVLGIVNTLALSVLERTRELGLLRAVGMARRQVKRMIRVEAVVIALFGGVLGLAIGTGLGVAVQHALAGQGVTELSIPGGRLLAFFLLSGLAGMLAAWLPARRAARLNVLAAVASE
ncbi:MAG: ABC transporter permease [Actinobacteria bacterium]|nr:ABC transporter permease [Actinomycetota bacterium]MBI3686114.1 ABC transporter permease [Actinomycetota bacterium]